MGASGHLLSVRRAKSSMIEALLFFGGSTIVVGLIAVGQLQEGGGVDLARLLPEVAVAVIFAGFCSVLIRVSLAFLKDERVSRDALVKSHEDEWAKTVTDTAVRFERAAKEWREAREQAQREEREARTEGFKAITKEMKAVSKVIAKGDAATASAIKRSNRRRTAVRKGA